MLARLAGVVTCSLSLATMLLLPGLSLVVHFGVFKLLAGTWRLAGVDCRPLILSPLAPLYQVIQPSRRNSLFGLDLGRFVCIH
jgi:hypothetical protein